MTDMGLSYPAPVLGANGPEVKPPRRYIKTFGLSIAVLGTLMILWALATPLMAYPDEPAHTVKAAAVARGQITVEPGTNFGHGAHVLVPAYIANLDAQKCFAARGDITADCAPAIPTDQNQSTIGVTSAGLYNPLYYWIVGLPTLIMSGAPALFAMRILSCIMAAGFYAAALASLCILRRPRWPIIGFSIAVTPMVLFLSMGINPSSIEVAATTAVFCGILAVTERARHGYQLTAPVVTIAVGGVVLANTRNVSLAWLAFAVLIALCFASWQEFRMLLRKRQIWLGAGLTAVGAVFGLVWILTTLKAPPATGDAPIEFANPNPDIAPYQAFMTMLDRTMDFVSQYVGTMGWLDAPLPQIVYMYWYMLILPLGLLPILIRRKRWALGYWLAAGALIFVPALIQAALVTSVGYIWQGRYSLPLFVMAAISAGMTLRFTTFSRSERSQKIGRLMIFSGVVAHVVAFAYVLRRYTVGLRGYANWQTMFTKPAWQPPLGWEALTLLYGIVVLIGAAFLFRELWPGARLLTLNWRWGTILVPVRRRR